MTLPIERVPTPKDERFKYTNLPRALKKLSLTAATLGWTGNIALLDPHAPGTVQYGDTALWDINTAHAKDIKVITTDSDITVDVQDGQWLSPRIIIHVKENETLTVTERQNGQGGYWKNQVVQIVIGKNAKLRHYRFFDEAAGSVHSGFVHVKIARDATYESFTLIEGAGTIRNQIHAEIQGENAHCWLNGVNLLSADEHADTTITIEHQAAHCTSKQTFKSVLTGKAHGVFQGKVHVHQIAQKTDGYQLSNALILSPEAQMDTKPELEIYADDVKCSHGATTGRLDDAPLFYMRARGIPEREARALMIQSFCGQAVEEISDETTQEIVTDRIAQWLSARI